MSYVKAFLEQVSVDMGLGGEITEAVLAESDRRSLQSYVNVNAKLRSRIRALAGQSGSSMPIKVVIDPENPSPMLTGESGYHVTRGGRRIWHPSAYSRVGWSNMHYRCSTRRIEVDADWLAMRASELAS